MEPNPNTQPAAPVQVPPAAPAAPEDNQKDYLIAFLLSWLLGGLGADRFYLGYIKTGILKLITLGGLGIWAVIDVLRLTFGRLKDKGGLPLRGYEKNKTWTRALAILQVIGFVVVVLFYVFVVVLATKSITDKAGSYSPVVNTGKVEQMARDTQRQTSINDIQGGIEMYNARSGSYPTLSQINSPTFRQTSLNIVTSDAYKDPSGSSDQLAANPGANHQYVYQPTPDGCSGTKQSACTNYTLSAQLEADGVYSKTALK